MKLSKALSALPYAHLLGVAAKAEEDDEKKQRADENDEDYAKRMKAVENEDDEDESDQKDAKSENDSGNDEPDEDDPKTKSKAKADDEEDEKDKKDNAKAARDSERARCKAIFACESAGIRPDVAAHLAFETDMTSADAVAMLKTVAAGSKASGLASRMASVKLPNVGSGADSASPGLTVAQQIIAAGKKRRGEA